MNLRQAQLAALGKTAAVKSKSEAPRVAKKVVKKIKKRK